MEQDIKTLQIHHLEKRHRLRNEVLILTAEQFFDSIHPDRHYRNRFYSVFLFKKAAGSVIIDDHTYDLQTDRFFFLNYNQVYHFSPLSVTDGFVIMFTKSFYNYIYTGNKLVRSDTALADVPVMIDPDPASKKELCQNFETIKNEFRRNRLFSKEIICMQLKILMLKYIRASKTATEPDILIDHKKEIVENFSELVNQHYKEFKTTAPYAEILNLTPNYLNSLVKEQLALSAGRFIKNRVILEAERLLLHTTLSVAEISYELGFTDNSHFGKYFKSASGTSPKNYRTEKRS